MKRVDPAYSLKRLSIPPFGDLMNKSGTLITSALLTLGLAAAASAADMPKAAAPMAADAPAAAAPAADAREAGCQEAQQEARRKLPPLLRQPSKIIGITPRPLHGGRGVFYLGADGRSTGSSSADCHKDIHLGRRAGLLRVAAGLELGARHHRREAHGPGSHGARHDLFAGHAAHRHHAGRHRLFLEHLAQPIFFAAPRHSGASRAACASPPSVPPSWDSG